MRIVGNAPSGGKKPTTPTIGTATGGNALATVAFTASTYLGKGGTVTYTATSSPGNITGTSTTSPITVSGLTNGTAYTFTVTATTSYGVTSDSSSASNSVTPAAPVLPVVTGGDLTSDATYYYRTFNSSGTLGVSAASISLDYQVVAGGGAGGAGQYQASRGTFIRRAGGSGGGGGNVYFGSQVFSPNSYSVAIGAGGTFVSNGTGNSGSGTTFITNTTGGGGGGKAVAGLTGGSGGGGGSYYALTACGEDFASYPGGSPVSGQGSAGTAGYAVPGTVLGGAGGGKGGGSAGGGVIVTKSAGGTQCGTTGPANSGNGGGGRNGPSSGTVDGYSGGSGVVVVRYLRSAVGG